MNQASHRKWVCHIVAWVLCSLLYSLQTTAQAEPLPLESAEESIKLLLTQEATGVEGRVEISIGQPDPRLNLAPCQEIEPFLPPNTRPWGRINIGLRCKAGARWSIYLPATVRVYGKALVAKKNLMSGTIPADNEVELIE
ncbi:MAG: hypothetical protein JNM52_10265, partial [Betaproteobacteria bacterium]|nr:hypothetical protein [Betaproteobacteria bacterium]